MSNDDGSRRGGLGRSLQDILASTSGQTSTADASLFGQQGGDTGWIDVGSTRVKAIRWMPASGGNYGEEGYTSAEAYTGNLYVRFIKYDTAYVYRGVPRPTADAVYGMGMAGAGIGRYVNDVLNGYSPRGYASDVITGEELAAIFNGDGGSYQGPGSR